MYELNGVLRPVPCLLWERQGMLLLCKARLAQLIGVVNVRQTTDEAAARHPLHAVRM